MKRTAVAVLLLAGCASAPDSGVPVSTATSRVTVAPQTTMDITRKDEVDAIEVRAPRKAVWQAMLATHASLEIPMSGSDENAGAASFTLRDKTRTLLGKPASSYVDCGNGPAGPRADSYRITVKISHKVHALAADQTLIGTLVEAWARHPGQSADAIQCNSRGTLEKYLSGIIATRSLQ